MDWNEISKQSIAKKAAEIALATVIAVIPFALMGSALAGSFEPIDGISASSLLTSVSDQASSGGTEEFSWTDEASLPEDFAGEAAKEDHLNASSQETQSAASSSAASSWEETAMTPVTMAVLLPCFSREKALEGSKVVDTLEEGALVTVIGKTSTNYYKLQEGGYVYQDFLKEAPAGQTSSQAGSGASSKPTSSKTSEKTSSSASSKPPVVHDGTVKGILNSAPLNPRKTGFASLDQKISSIFSKIFTPGMDTYGKVKACYDYLINNTIYGRVNYPTAGFGNISPEGCDNYIAWAASSCLDKGVATCNRYSAAFIAMCRTIGLDARYVDGQTSAAAGGFIGHVWVEVVINGTTYVFDPQVEDNITKGGTIKYQRFCKTYAQVPNKYIK